VTGLLLWDALSIVEVMQRRVRYKGINVKDFLFYFKLWNNISLIIKFAEKRQRERY
jgi:hypothetical protein